MSLFLQLSIALGIGAVLGWLFGRFSAPRPDNRLENELRQQLQQREVELASAREQSTRAASSLSSAEAKRDAAEQLLAKTSEFQEKALADLRQTFQALSAEALKQSSPQFLQLAGQTFAKMQETAKGDLSTLVQPLKEQLDIYQKRLQQSESTQSTALGEVKKQLESLTQNSKALSDETSLLRRVLSSNQARGKWGEETLRRVLEASGMTAHFDFREQTQVEDSKPDLLIHLPNDRVIIIDSKVPDLEFLHSIDSAETSVRAEALQSHAAKLKETIRDLAKRNYPAQFSNSLDYVVLFVPAESLFSAALEGDRELVNWAAQKKIILATPTSLYALLRVVTLSWQQHAQAENARKIAETAQAFFNRVTTFVQHFERLRSGLEKASSAFNDAVGSYDRSVRPKGEELLGLGLDSPAKELPKIEPLPATLRLPPVKIAND